MKISIRLKLRVRVVGPVLIFRKLMMGSSFRAIEVVILMMMKVFLLLLFNLPKMVPRRGGHIFVKLSVNQGKFLWVTFVVLIIIICFRRGRLIFGLSGVLSWPMIHLLIPRKELMFVIGQRVRLMVKRPFLLSVKFGRPVTVSL